MGRQKGEKEKAYEQKKMKKERVVPACYSYSSVFQVCTVETESGLLTARLGGKQRTSEPFQHASLSITPSRAGTPVLAPG